MGNDVNDVYLVAMDVISDGAMLGSILCSIIAKHNVVKLCRNPIVKELTLLFEFPILTSMNF
jgi:hypothetical protein